MNYLRITFSDVETDEQEKLIALLGNFDFSGFEQKDHQLLAFIEYDLFEEGAVQHIISDYVYEKETIPEMNWNAKWESDFQPIIIDDTVAIRADFHEAINSVTHEIVITPKMSFGTGHHATTQQMLQQMSKQDFKNKNVLDYGTGTGVLAIYAEMLGAKKIIANDIDPWSEENANENIERNNCKNVAVRLGGLEEIPEENFDIILANINLNVLKADLSVLFSKLNKNGGLLILSGILENNEKDIINYITPYSTDYHIFKRENWLCITVKK